MSCNNQIERVPHYLRRTHKYPYHRLIPILLLLSWTGFVQAGKAQTLHAVPKNPRAPEFTLKDIDGRVHHLSSYRGRVVIVNFWASWCPPCRYEMPSLERASKKLKSANVIILAINVGEKADTIFTFSVEYPVNFPLLMDIDSKVIKQWPVIGLPTTFVVDPGGRIVYRANGDREWDHPAMIKKIRVLARPSRPDK